MQDAERIALAQELGALSLSLRGVGDDQVVKKDWPTISDVRLTTVDDEIYEEYNKRKQTGSGGVSGSVKIYSGGTVQTVPVQ